MNKNKNMHFQIDCFQKDGNNILIKGWGISLLSGKSLSLRIVLKDDTVLGPFFASEERTDISSAYIDIIASDYYGYNITLEKDFKQIKGLYYEDAENNLSEYVKISRIKRTDTIFHKMLPKLFPRFPGFVNALKVVYQIIFIQRKFPKSITEIKKYIKNFFRIIAQHADYDYDKWINDFEPTKDELDRQSQYVFEKQPKISILTPTYNTPPKFFDELMESLIAQTYKNWELCVADGGSGEETLNTLKKWQKIEPRFKLKILEKNLGIAGNTNAAADLADGDFIALLDHDDIIVPFALYEVVKVINENENVDFIYSDEDKIDDGKRYAPYFKPDFSPDFLRSNNYICHFTVMSAKLFNDAGRFRSEFDGSQDHDLFLRATEKAKKIIHITKILYSWRVHIGSVAQNPGSKSYAADAGMNAVKEQLERLKLSGRVDHREKMMFCYRIHPELSTYPHITIIIPNKDSKDYLHTCINSILKLTTYPNYDILVVENNSTTKEIFAYYDIIKKIPNVSVIKWGKEFNYSAINNFAVEKAKGEYVLFLNSDTKIITPEWLEEMMMFAVRDDVGAVGSKLYYKNNTVQHCGIVVGMTGTAAHAHKGLLKYELGYYGRAALPFNVSAVTGACMLMKKDYFLKLGGFDISLKVAYNDIDLCLKIRADNKLIVYTPYAELFHFESKVRGNENSPKKKERFYKEIKQFVYKWEETLRKGDPYYNKNLTLLQENYFLKKPTEPDLIEHWKKI